MSYLQSGKRSVMGFMDTIEYSNFEVSKEEIANINTPEDYDKLLKSLS
jgi:molybdopterin-guanine dinucleotide biosynthesis protein A